MSALPTNKMAPRDKKHDKYIKCFVDKNNNNLVFFFFGSIYNKNESQNNHRKEIPTHTNTQKKKLI